MSVLGHVMKGCLIMKLKISSIVFILLSYGALACPIYKTAIDGSESYDLIIRGLNFAEFSLWGCLMLVIPIVLIALTYCNIKNRWKSVVLVAIYILNTIVIYNASIAADKWIRDVATGFVLCRPYQLLYAISLLVSMVCLFVHLYKDPDLEK